MKRMKFCALSLAFPVTSYATLWRSHALHQFHALRNRNIKLNHQLVDISCFCFLIFSFWGGHFTHMYTRLIFTFNIFPGTIKHALIITQAVVAREKFSSVFIGIHGDWNNRFYFKSNFIAVVLFRFILFLTLLLISPRRFGTRSQLVRSWH